MSTSLPEPRWYSIGPHGFYDLVRLARRGRSSLVRVGYLLALFAVLAVVYDQTPRRTPRPPNGIKNINLGSPEDLRTESINTNARIAERFCIAILVMQNIAVLLLMPIYVAASVHEEHDKRTLPILFTTHLTAREIILGKWVSRVGHVGSILLGGLPVLSFVQLWGGIDMPMIAANFVNTACWLASVGGLSMMMATHSRTLVRSLVMSYMLIFASSALVTCCCMPYFYGEQVWLLQPDTRATNGYFAMWVLMSMFAAGHIGLTVFFVRRAELNLESQRGREPLPPDPIDSEFEPAPMKRLWQLPAVGDNPLVWKERYVGQHLWIGIPPYMLPILVFTILSYLAALIPGKDSDIAEVRENYRLVFAAITLLNFGIYILLVAYRLAGCVVSERERHTLDSLLTLPISSTDLLRAKVIGNLQRCWTWLIPCGIAFLVMAFLTGRNPLGDAVLALALAIHLGFFAMLSLFLSVVCRTIVAAYVSLSVVLLLLLFGTLATGQLGISGDRAMWINALNPVGCWLVLAREHWQEDVQPELAANLVGLAIYAGLTGLLWIAARYCFTRRV